MALNCRSPEPCGFCEPFTADHREPATEPCVRHEPEAVGFMPLSWTRWSASAGAKRCDSCDV
jgi:hypothetical protein